MQKYPLVGIFIFFSHFIYEKLQFALKKIEFLTKIMTSKVQVSDKR